MTESVQLYMPSYTVLFSKIRYFKEPEGYGKLL